MSRGGDESGGITIRGIIAPVKSGILIDGTGGGGQVKIDFAETSVEDVKRLMNLRMAPLKITFAYDDGK
jgi:hypothetical protein